ncbi:hypothetical protein LTR17_025752 [Elasticomyces elasticus]|nr:hypothetical protein LTR17_025752 [Elasticomyces elasticus]
MAHCGRFRQLRLHSIGKGNAVHIAVTRSSAEHLAAIDDLSACMTHLTLAQRMHIYMLYKEAVPGGGEIGEAMKDYDPFILQSGVSSVRSPGNPNHLLAAAITRNMTASGQSPTSAKKLWHVGRRLYVLVAKFGRGVLALLTEKLTTETIPKVTDQVFVNFAEVIDRFEDHRIRFVSECASPIVVMLFDDGDKNYATMFRLENI